MKLLERQKTYLLGVNTNSFYYYPINAGKSYFNRILYIRRLYKIWAILGVKYCFNYLLRTKLTKDS